MMKKIPFLGSILIIVCILLSGCLNIKDNENGGQKIFYISISFMIIWKTIPTDTYVMFPTLLLENGTILSPIYEEIVEYIGEDSFHTKGTNISVIDTEHGKAIKYRIRTNYFKFSKENCSYIQIPYELGSMNITIDGHDMDINERYYKDGPGFSMWEKGSIWIYFEGDAGSISIELRRSTEMDDIMFTSTVVDRFRNDFYEPENSGWHKIEMERILENTMD